jgi:hypothetical protein
MIGKISLGMNFNALRQHGGTKPPKHPLKCSLELSTAIPVDQRIRHGIGKRHNLYDSVENLLLFPDK